MTLVVMGQDGGDAVGSVYIGKTRLDCPPKVILVRENVRYNYAPTAAN